MIDSIFSDDFVSLGTITSRSENANYPDDNVEDYWHLKRRFRAADNNVNDWLLKFELDEYGEPLVGIFVNDVNFDQIQIQGTDTDAAADPGWNNPEYDSGVLTVNRDERVDRYKIYITLTNFDYAFIRIFIPATASTVPGGYTGAWEVGSVVLLGSVFSIKKNAYSRKSAEEFQEISLPHGGFERAALGDELRWEGSITIEQRAESDEEDYWDINLMEMSQPLVFYERVDDSSKAYLCVRDTEFEANLVHRGLFRGNTIKLKELI